MQSTPPTMPCSDCSKEQRSGFVIVLTIFAVIGGFLFGYDTGVVSGAVILLKNEFHLTNFLVELFVSVTLGLAGSVCAAKWGG